MGESPEAGEPGPEEITCSGGLRLPLLNAVREQPQKGDGDE